jgi:hypothetical protein
LELGFSLETDIRDFSGGVVVAHDPPELNGDIVLLDEFLSTPRADNQFLALNVKADGLLPLLTEKNLGSHFYFDMSIPETIKYSSAGETLAIRASDYEKMEPTLIELIDPEWVWLDAFETDWYLNVSIPVEFFARKMVVVSPELHGRNPDDVWAWVSERNNQGLDVAICTDFPEDFIGMANRNA